MCLASHWERTSYGLQKGSLKNNTELTLQNSGLLTGLDLKHMDFIIKPLLKHIFSHFEIMAGLKIEPEFQKIKP